MTENEPPSDSYAAELAMRLAAHAHYLAELERSRLDRRPPPEPYTHRPND